MERIVERYISILEALATNPNDYFGRNEARILLTEIKALGPSEASKYKNYISVLEKISQDETIEGIDYTLDLDPSIDVDGNNFDAFIDQLINFFSKRIAKKVLDAFVSKKKSEEKIVLNEDDFEKFFDVSIPAPKTFKSNEIYFANKLNNNDCFAYDAFEDSIKFIPQYFSTLKYLNGKSTRKDYATYGVDIKNDTCFMKVIDKTNDYLKAKKIEVDIYFYSFLRHLFDVKGLHTVDKSLFGTKDYFANSTIRDFYNENNRFFKNTTEEKEFYIDSSSWGGNETRVIYRETNLPSFVGAELKIDFYLVIESII